MPIYRRTPAGTEAAFNIKSSVPRKLRTLLVAVDGHTELGIYVRTLYSFGDVAALLGALEESGFVELVEKRKPADPDGATSVRSAHSTAPLFAVTSPAPAKNWAPATGRSAFGAPSGAAGYPLRKALLLISDFVTLHLPDQSMEIVLALEALGSVEQLVGSLQGYEALVTPLGMPARQHLAELRQVLTTN
ncbi:hypothetical protein [Polaromonas sp. CG_9.11]|uniref:hypothetical protein n=1 Tax=Polaromonas sp. CG_9.11 TaxID=2787730 RepID=UPI0018CA0EB8|nr:hypothetical protein [Polaromonas sp. CG_9.11]MBG6077145.1 hypothetical protein [Polaromonas sp. CG_9.11]